MTEPRQIAIMLYPGMTTLDAIGPYEVLRLLPGVEIRFVWHAPGPIVTDHNILVLGATHSFEETPNPWMVLVPGSEANTVTVMSDAKAIAWLRKAHQNSTLTCSVCSGSLILAAAGILDGKPATSHWIAQSALKRFNATPMRHDRIVKSDKIYTAAGVSAGIDLALQIAIDHWGTEEAAIAQLLIEYDPAPPVDSGHPDKAAPRIHAEAKTRMLAAAKNPRNLISVPKLLWQQYLRRVRRR